MDIDEIVTCGMTAREIAYFSLVLFMLAMIAYQRWRYKVWNWVAAVIVTILSSSLAFAWWMRNIQ